MLECASEALPINVTDVMEEGASRTLIFGPSRPKRCRAGARKAVLALAGEGHPRAPPEGEPPGAYQKVREDVSQTPDAAPVRQREGMRREKDSRLLESRPISRRS